MPLVDHVAPHVVHPAPAGSAEVAPPAVPVISADDDVAGDVEPDAPAPPAPIPGMRRVRGANWGRFRIAKVCPGGIHKSWGVTCGMHVNPDRPHQVCQRQLAGTSDETRLTNKADQLTVAEFIIDTLVR